MKSNFHTTRKAVISRGFDKASMKQGGAKPKNWSYNDRNARQLTGPVKTIKYA
jgi:hypothetical protein